MDKLSGVADTLYIPLCARIYVSKRFPDFFYDEKALSLEKEIPDDSIQKNSSEYFNMASVCRYKVMDKMIEDFINKHNKCNIINLGAGLETACFRLDIKDATFYEIDLPAVIETRKKVLNNNKKEILISCDIFDLSWTKQINNCLPSLIIASGVFQYFNEDKIISLIKKIKDSFDNVELIFDAMNHKAIKYANKYVKKTGNKNAEMYFYIDDPKLFSDKCNITFIERKPFFTEARKKLKSKLNIYTRIAMKVVDEGSRTGYILHYDLKERA